MKEEIGIPASEAKLHFGELLNQCVYGRKEVIIKKHNKPVAILVNFEEWKNKEVKENTNKEHPLLIRIKKLHQRIKDYQRKNGIKDTTSAVDLIRQSRQEREAKLLKGISK